MRLDESAWNDPLLFLELFPMDLLHNLLYTQRLRDQSSRPQSQRLLVVRSIAAFE